VTASTSRPVPRPRQPEGRGWHLVLWEMLKVGATAFGGGSATTVAIRRAALRRGWLSEDDFLDTVVVSRLTPGITILAQVILIGKRVCGWRGIVAGMAGMMLPAVVITVAFAKAYTSVSDSPTAVSPLRCLAGAAAGFTIALVLQLLRDTLRRAPRVRGPVIFLLYVGLALLIGNPVLFLCVVIVAGVAVPFLFETPEPEPVTAAETPDGVPGPDRPPPAVTPGERDES
jgi:chromate transporter